MRRAALLPLLILAMAPVRLAGAGVPLGEAWFRVQQAVDAGDVVRARSEAEDLVRLGKRTGVRRMPTWGRALTAVARKSAPPERAAFLDIALLLDPDCPEAYFLRSEWAWHGGNRGAAVLDALHGWRASLSDPFRRRELMTSAVGWGLLALVAVGIVAMLVQTGRYLPELGHDALELGKVLFTTTNARIFAAVAITLPLFAGLGPVWLLGYLFALCWIYFPLHERVVFGLVWLAVMLAVPSLELWQGWALSEAPPAERAVTALDNDLVIPFTMEELLSLSTELDRVPAFHMLAGEASHLLGEIITAAEQFGRAALAAPDDPIPHVWLGNIALEEGDTRLAIQEYRKAIQKRPDLGMAYFDLSVALDQDHLFTEADTARNRARALGLSGYPGRFQEVDGLKLLYPHDARLLLERLRRETPAEKRRFVRSPDLDLRPRRILGSAWVLAFLCTGLFGLLVLWARGRWMWTAQACSRCGKVFCSRCKTTSESRSYCSQCIAVFLTRGAVSIEQQAAKMEQIRKRQRLLLVIRRLGSIVVPGFGDLIRGRSVRGLLNGIAAAIALTGIIAWAPLFARPIVSSAGVMPLRAGLLVLLAISWLVSIRRGWRKV